MATLGWKLDPAERARLLERFAPEWPDPVADHVTLKAKAPPREPLPAPATGEIVGTASDGRGVEALVVRISGTTARPGGGTYHITWSLDRKAGRKAVESNDVIAARGWTTLAEPVPVALKPARF